MSNNKNILHLQDNERILGIVKKSICSELWRILFAFIWILLPFFFLFPLLQFDFYGVIFFIILLLSGILYAFKLGMTLVYTMLIVTDQRIIDIEHFGFFSREINAVELKEIRTVKVLKRGFIKKIINLGDLVIKIDKKIGFDIEVLNIKKPQTIRQFIDDVRKVKEN